MWIARRKYVALDRARDRNEHLLLHDDDCTRPGDEAGRIDAGAHRAVELRMLVLVIVIGGRDRGSHLMHADRVVMIPLMLLRAMVRFPMR